MPLQREIDSEDKDHWFWGTEKHDQLFSKLGYVLVCAQSLCRVRLFVSPWTVARQAPLSMGFPRQEYWSGLQFPSPRDLPNPGIEAASPVSLALVGGFFTARAIWCSAYLVGKKDWGSQCSDIDGLQLCTAPALLLGSLGQVLSIS